MKLRDAEFPAVVCEAGWSEAHKELMDDARLWLLQTGGQTRIVIVLSYTENKTKSPLEAANQMSEDEVLTGGSMSEEQTVVNGIDKSTNYKGLVKMLLDLNRQGKLEQPLVGSLKATLYVYRASEDGKDIMESFRTTVLPPPPVGERGPREFGVTMGELLGDSVPEGQDPADAIIFDLEGLEGFITRSIPGTGRLRAGCRAKKLMIAAGVWEEKETFSHSRQQRRLDHSGV